MSFFSFLISAIVIQFLILCEGWSGKIETSEKALFYTLSSFFCGAITGYHILEYTRQKLIENLLAEFSDVF